MGGVGKTSNGNIKRPPTVFKFENVFYTFAVMFNYFGYGVGNTILGPSLVDLSYIYEVAEHQMNLAPLFVSIGYVAGALSAGQLSRWFHNRQIVMSCLLLPMGIVPFFVLHLQPLGLALCFFFVFGSGLGAMDAGMSVWIVELWPHHSSIILPFSSALFGVGQIFGPIVMSPFVYGNIDPDDVENLNITRVDRIKSLTVPYTTTGAIQTFIPILYIILSFTSLRYRRPTQKEENKDAVPIEDPRLTQNPSRFYHLILAGIGIASYGAAEQGWNAFAPTMFQHMGDRMFNASDASLLVAVWSGAFAFGLLITTVVALRYTPDKIIFFQFVIVFMSLLLLYLGHNTKTLVYVGTVIFGSGMSSLWAMKFAFIELHLKLTDQVASAYTVLFGLFGIMIPIILEGVSTEHPIALLPLMIAFLGISCISFTICKIWLNVVEKKRTPILDESVSDTTKS